MRVGLLVGWFLLGLVLGTTSLPLRAEGPAVPALQLTVVPRVPPTQTHTQWAPFVARLARDTGTTIALRLFKTLGDFERAVTRGEPDLVYLNPYEQVVARRRHGYVPLVREGSDGLSGALVVARDGPIRGLADLQGKVIAFPHPNAFGASLYLRALLTERHGIRFTAQYLGTHSNVYRHVLRGLAAGGGGVNVTLRQELPEVQAGLTILYETPPVAPHPLSAHPRLPATLRERIARAVLAMAEDDSGRALLAAVNLREPVRADHARDYAPLERLNLERYFDPSANP